MSERATPSREIREPSYADAIIPLVALITLIAGSVYLFGLDAFDGPLQVALVLCAMLTSVIVLKNGHPWEAVAESGRKGISSVVGALFILLSIGALIGTWNMSGTIPTLVYYGIRLIDPDWYYLASALICGAISLSIGSSWTTAGTVGVGLVGIAMLIGVSPIVTAGAVISGSYLGDKTSPLSETTVLAAELAKVEIHTHIRAQMWTSIPAFAAALAVFAILGLRAGASAVDDSVTTAELLKLDQLFWITPLNLLPLLLLLGLSLRKAPSSLAITFSALVAGLMAVAFQPDVVRRFVADPTHSTPVAAIKAVWLAMATGFSANSGIREIDALLSRGGMYSMLKTIWLIIGAVTFGSLLEEFGLLPKLIDPILARAKTTGRLYATVVSTAIGLNVIAGDQYIALVLPARLFRVEFENRGLRPQNLSRAVADAGTVTSPLVPWNSCGAYMSAVLGISTLLYLPFCVFNIASPILTFLYGVTGFKIERLEPGSMRVEKQPG